MPIRSQEDFLTSWLASKSPGLYFLSQSCLIKEDEIPIFIHVGCGTDVPVWIVIASQVFIRLNEVHLSRLSDYLYPREQDELEKQDLFSL
jgi:hypothetical protein